MVALSTGFNMVIAMKNAVFSDSCLVSSRGFDSVSVAAVSRARHSLSLVALALAYLLQIPVASAQTAQTPFTNWILSLQQKGFVVQQGAATEFNFNDCTNLYAPTFGGCFGNNPVTPYILINPPQAALTKNQNLPPYMSVFGSTGPTAPPNTMPGPQLNTFYQLDINEAIVVVMTLPPQAAYYSYQSYMFSRPVTSYGQPAVPQNTHCPGHYPTGGAGITTPDCMDYQVFGYFDNAINDIDVVHAPGGLQFSNNGSKAIAFITTANQTLYNELYTSFQAFGPQSELFLEHMPLAGQAALNLGVTAQTFDKFISIIRYAVPNGGPPGPGPTWVMNAPSNVLVYRIQDTALNSGNSTPVIPGTINPPSCNNDETAATGNPANCPITSTYFDQDLRQLILLLGQYVNTNLPAANYVSTQFSLSAGQAAMNGSPSGPICIANGYNCAGSIADNDGYRGIGIGTLVPNHPAFVVGVFHSASTEVTTTTPVNNATYTAVGAADANYNAGAVDTAQENLGATMFSPTPGYQQLGQSAAKVLAAFGIQISPMSQLAQDLPNLYIAVFARTATNCNGLPYCAATNSYTDIIFTSQPAMTTLPYIPSGDPVFLTERGYILPSANASPASNPLSYLTGASAPFLESPYVLYATN